MAAAPDLYLWIFFPPLAPIHMAHKSLKAQYGAYFAMTEKNGNHLAAKELYDKWVPEEPVSRWKSFALACHERFSVAMGSVGGAKRGRHHKIPGELAHKIGTVYSQRMVWEHGVSRHYRDMDEVRAHGMHGARAQSRVPGQVPLHPPQPSPNLWQYCCRPAGCTPSSRRCAPPPT